MTPVDQYHRAGPAEQGGFHHHGDGERIYRTADGVPVIGKEPQAVEKYECRTRGRRNASARKWESAFRNSLRRLSNRTGTKRNRSERKGRRSRDMALEYSTGDGNKQISLTTRQAADLKDGGPRYPARYPARSG